MRGKLTQRRSLIIVSASCRHTSLVQRPFPFSNFSVSYLKSNTPSKVLEFLNFIAEMLFEKYPRLFRTRHWTELWHSNLADLPSTKHVAPSTIFVAVDTEPWLDGHGKKRDDKEASEIGLAFLFPGRDAGQNAEPPRTFEQACERFPVSSHCIRIRDRKQFFGERFWKGGEKIIPTFDPHEVEEALISLVQTAQQQASSGDNPPTLTLVGFDLHIEFLILSHHYPRLLHRFNSWVDVQDLAKGLTTMPQAPSLQNILIAFGYERACPAIAANSKGHNAGNDAMRTICALLILLFYQPEGEKLVQVCHDYHSNRAKQRRIEQRNSIGIKRRDLFYKRYPTPRERYPFQAKVDLPGLELGAPLDPETLCEYFAKYKPVAAGGNSSKIFGGWICLASLEELNVFVQEVDGFHDTEGRGKWTAFSRYDPTVVPAITKAELDEYLNQKAMTEIAEKKRVRLRRKQREAEEARSDWA